MKQKCCHDGCEVCMPEAEDKVPPGWTMARVEEYKEKTIATYFVYLCPDHKLTTANKQASLFEET
jgi:hypothetical protein